jgi:bifunctional non-homologous end joining protein LigD
MGAGRIGWPILCPICCTSTDHDLRRCPIEGRKALLCQLLDGAHCPRLVYVDHVVGRGADLFEHVRAIGAEGIVSKRAGSRYSGGATRDWRKIKCHATGQFIVTGFQQFGPGRLEALHVAEQRNDKLVSAGQVRFGFAGKRVWAMLDELRAGSPIATAWLRSSTGWRSR